MLGLTENLQAQLDALRRALSFAPAWAVSFIVLVTAVAVAWIIHAVTLAAVRRLVSGRKPFLRSILDVTKSPTRLGLLLLAFEIALPTAPLGPDTKDALERCLALGTIFLLGWIALTSLHALIRHQYQRSSSTPPVPAPVTISSFHAPAIESR